MLAEKKQITLCADDFALSEGVSRGIISLIESERISATSCMTTEKRWKKDAKLLMSVADKADVGLHFNLTEGEALSVNPFNKNNRGFMGLGQVMKNTLLRQVDLLMLQQELNAQLDAFVDAMGCLPDFIDGHQHIHHLPVVRTAVVNVYRERLNNHHCYIRSVSPLVKGLGGFFTKQHLKEWVIAFTGGRYMKGILATHHIPCNTVFAGIYDFSQVSHFPQMMERWLNSASDGALIMCHPGLESGEEDVLHKSRPRELEYLQSDAFSQACEINNIGIGRFSC